MLRDDNNIPWYHPDSPARNAGLICCAVSGTPAPLKAADGTAFGGGRSGAMFGKAVASGLALSPARCARLLCLLFPSWRLFSVILLILYTFVNLFIHKCGKWI